MESGRSRQLASKWMKTQALIGDPDIARHIPETGRYRSRRLREMTLKYGMVVLKPVCGTGGIGLIQVRRLPGGYELKHKTSRKSVRSFSEVLRGIQGIRGKKPYLIQQGIELATVENRPIDYRVKFVKENGSWRIRSMVGRIAARGLFVTNLCRGGKMVSGTEGLKRSLPQVDPEAKKSEMRDLTKRCTGLLESHFPGIGQLGYDYGIDRNGQIWILEVNTRPH